MKRIITICALIAMLSCSKENGRSFKGMIAATDHCCSSMEGGKLYKINMIGTDSTINTVLPADYHPGETIAFNIHPTDTPPAIMCLAICTMPQIVKLSDVTRIE